MPLPTGLFQRNGVWQLRIGVPADLRHLYPGIDAYRASLKTRDRDKAITAAHARIAEYRAKFDQLRSAEALKRSPPTVGMTPELEAYLSQQAGWVALTFDDVVRVTPGAIEALAPGVRFLTSPDDPPTPIRLGDDPQRWHRLQIASLELARADLAAGRLDKAQSAADADLKALGLTVDWNDTVARLALMRIARAQVRAFQLAVERGQGEPHDTPARPIAPRLAEETHEAPAATSPTLRDVVDDWVALTRAKDNAKLRTERALALWEEAVGDVPLDKITRATGTKFVAFLLSSERPFGASTAANHAACINALMNIAEKVEKVEKNPLALSFRVEDAEKRHPWTAEELATIFGSRLFSDDPGIQPFGVDFEDARLWLWQLLWSGARAGEIAQLRVDDVEQRDGVLCLHITPEAGTTKGKRKRWIPVAEVVQPWLHAHLLKRRASGDPLLFPSFHRRLKTTPADLATRWFREFRKAHGLPPGALNGSHRFRHAVRTRLAELGISPDQGDQLTGHTVGGSTGRKVYTGTIRPQVLAQTVERLGWEWPTKKIQSPGTGSVPAVPDLTEV